MKRLNSPALLLLFCAGTALAAQAAAVRTNQFSASTKEEASRWQSMARERLFTLMMGGSKPERVPLAPEVSRREPSPDGIALEEITLQSLPDRRLHAWVAWPSTNQPVRGAVLALHGHGGTGEQIVRGQGLYWYGRELVKRGYAIVSPDIGQHTLQHTNWSLMGERVWDALRCLDYFETRPELKGKKMAVAGLSLGGETTMYVAAMDTRIRAACSSGWLTTVENMKHGHCPCWNFPGLEENFDFADIFACVAPRPLVCEIGEKETAPGGFPVSIAQPAFDQIRKAYAVFSAAPETTLHIHPAGHVFQGTEFWKPLERALGR